MQQPTTLFVGLDVHKCIRRLRSKARDLVFAYEAGPCGYGLYRHLTSKGFDCRWWRHR